MHEWEFGGGAVSASCGLCSKSRAGVGHSNIYSILDYDSLAIFFSPALTVLTLFILRN